MLKLVDIIGESKLENGALEIIFKGASPYRHAEKLGGVLPAKSRLEVG